MPAEVAPHPLTTRLDRPRAQIASPWWSCCISSIRMPGTGQWLRTRGHPLDVRGPRFGDPLPESLEHHAGAVIFGGPMSANDSEDYVKIETEWIGVALLEN